MSVEMRLGHVDLVLRSRGPAGRDRTTKGAALVLWAFKVALKDAYDCLERVR
jgi:hypothetical protein